MKHLLETNHPLDMIYKLWTTLDSESWMLDTTQVPLGWKIRFDCELNQDEYLSPDMRVYTSKEEVLGLITKASTPGQKRMAQEVQTWADL